jgi:hypothetical protein
MLAAAFRKVSRRAVVAWRERNIYRKSRIQENCGPRKEFAAAGRMMTRCTGVAQRKEHGLQKKGQDDMAPRTWKGCTCRLKRWKDPADRMGIKDPGGREPRDLMEEITLTTNGIGAWKSGQQLLLGSRSMQMKALCEMVSVDIAKQNTRSSARMWNTMDWTLWRGRSPP